MMASESLGHYRLEGKLGVGGMGVVYRAFDTKLHRSVAIKLVKSDAVSAAGSGSKLLREARSASALNHPNICTIYEVGETPEQSYIVMELVDGRPLREVIPPDGLPPETVGLYGAQIADALGHAHDRGVIHRDLKSANVMISPDGRTKALDFGIALRLPDQALETMTASNVVMEAAGTIGGTLPYMPPEVLRGDPPSTYGDVWSLGVLLHELSCGELPFRGDTTFELTAAILHTAPSPLPVTVPATLRAVIQRCLAKEPEVRYRHAAEVRVALEMLSSGMLSVSTGTLRSTEGLAGPRSVLVLPFTNLAAGDEEDYFADGLTDEVIADLSNVRALRVISRTSSMRLKGVTHDIPRLARDLNVQYVLEGSVRRSGNGLRVNATLVDAQTDSPVWVQKYRGTLDDVFAIQETLSHSIVEALKLKLSSEEEKRLAERPITDVRAYESYLKAKQEMLRFSKDALDRALAYLKQSEQSVGDNILLTSAKGQVYWQYINAGITADMSYLEKARACGEWILELDAESGHGHRLLGLIAVHEGDIRKAVTRLNRALARDPNDVDTLLWVSLLYGFMGRSAAAVPLTETLLLIDPLTPMHQIVPGMLALMEGRFEQALRPFLAHQNANLDNPVVRLSFGQILALNDRLEEAYDVFDALDRDMPGTLFAALGRFYQYALQGDRQRALSAVSSELREAARADLQYSWMMAQCCALVGELDESLDWLDRAVSRGFINYPLLSSSDPFLDAVRGQDRFQELMEDVHRQWDTPDAKRSSPKSPGPDSPA